jgi:hypothetical protein
LLGTSFAQFGNITKGPLSGNCSGPQFGLDTINNQVYVCSNSGTSNFQWYKIGAIGALPIGSIGQTLFNVDGNRTYAPTSNVLFDSNGNLIQLTALTWSIDETGAATFNSLTIPSDGVHPGKVVFVGNTTLPDLNDNTFTLLGPNSSTFTKYYLQFSLTEIPDNTAFCKNSSHIISYCTSAVQTDGTCTCQ